MPTREAQEAYVAELPYEEAFEPAQHALVRVAIKWLRLLTPEERREVRGISVEFEDVAPGLVPIPGREPIRVTLLKWEGES
jgi:hypothetical protein